MIPPTCVITSHIFLLLVPPAQFPVPDSLLSAPVSMQISDLPFQTTDWAALPVTEHRGTTGVATWRTKQHGPIRVRLVEYSPGYESDHWCQKGHILFCLSGELR